MRHIFKFDGLSAVDPGFLVQSQSTELLPIAADSFEGIIRENWANLRNEAYENIASRHVEAFPEETVEEAISNFRWLCGPGAETPAKSGEGWRTGDAVRVELLLENPEVKALSNESPKKILDTCLTEMIKNLIRRLHALEAPLVLYAFQAFQQATVPTQLPTALLVRSAKKHRISPDEMLAEIRRRPEFWKAELLDIATSFISSQPGDAEAKTMQIASVYQRIKAFFEEFIEEEPTEEPEKKPRRLRKTQRKG